MRRANRGYRGRRPRRGLTPEQVIAAALVTLAAILALTVHANSHWSGRSAGQQLYEAVFVTKDWE